MLCGFLNHRYLHRTVEMQGTSGQGEQADQRGKDDRLAAPRWSNKQRAAIAITSRLPELVQCVELELRNRAGKPPTVLDSRE
jgi:hypothetical protein